MYDVRELEGGLVLYVPDMPIDDDDWVVHARAYVDGHEVSGSGEGRLRADDLKILKVLTDTKSLCTLTGIKETVWGAGDHEEKLKGAIFRLRTIGLRKLKDDARSVIQNIPRKGYIYVGQVRAGKSDTLPDPPPREVRRIPLKPIPIASAPLQSSTDLAGRPVVEPPIPVRRMGAVAVGGIVLLIVGVITGYLLHRWISSSGSPAPNWERLLIQGGAEGRRVIWGPEGPIGEGVLQWTDIAWNEDEGWLCGDIVEGGGGGDVGTGILLHTVDHGNFWSRIDQTIPSGAGTFSWGPFQYSWKGVGPIVAIWATRRLLEAGKFRMELWLAAATGVYRSLDDGESWQRSTPRPDESGRRIPYAHFVNLFNVFSSGEIFAVGWLGIAHWTARDSTWELQFPSQSFSIGGIYAYPLTDSPDWDVWAAGSGGIEDRQNMIYHLKRPGTWEKFAPSGVDPAAGDLSDIVLTSAKSGFAVGPGGLIVKGTKNSLGLWSWVAVAGRKPTNRNLHSIVYADYTLWIVGDDGIVLRSENQGEDWKIQYLKDESGRQPNLGRIRSFGSSLWIVGNHVVYRYRK